MNVYTYYTPIPLYPDDSQIRLIEIWKRSWAKHGWTPRVFCEADAARHPRYEEFKKHVWNLPTEYGHEYETTCFLRWMAMAVWGGGLLADYDVMNYGLAPKNPDPEKMVLIADTKAPLFMGTVLGPGKLFEDMCQRFLDWEPDERDWNPNAKLYHCSDLTYLQQVLESKVRPCPTWLTWEDGCTVYPNISGTLVHYGYFMHRDGLWPKCDYIERVRPL